MPRAKVNNDHYYVLVFTNTGPVFVTKIGEGKTAYWNREEKPYEFSKNHAQTVALGLSWNGCNALPVMAPFELDQQPYRYDAYECKFIEKEQVDAEQGI